MKTGHNKSIEIVISGYIPTRSSSLGYESSNSRIYLRSHNWRPPTDLYETEENFIIRVEIAGISENDLNVVINGNLLCISGIRQDIPEAHAYHQMEIHFGEFRTEVEIPSLISKENIQAEYQNGFLWVTLHKAQPKQVHIE
jgi:HSP20 family protein